MKQENTKSWEQARRKDHTENINVGDQQKCSDFEWDEKHKREWENKNKEGRWGREGEIKATLVVIINTHTKPNQGGLEPTVSDQWFLMGGGGAVILPPREYLVLTSVGKKLGMLLNTHDAQDSVPYKELPGSKCQLFQVWEALL